MTYSINLATGEVTRDADGLVVAPCQSADDPEFVAYVAWVNEGNAPTEVYDPPAPEPEPVPQSVTMRQARLALLSAGLLDAIDAGIAAMPSPQREAAQIEWDYATDVQRDNPLVAGLAEAMGMTSEDIDGLFIAASQI